MGPLTYILLSIGIIGAALVLFFVLRKGPQPQGRSRPAEIREATRRLAQNPRDAAALKVLAEAAFEAQDFTQALACYQALLPLCAAHPLLNEFEVNLRYAQSAFNVKKYTEAYKAFLLARTLNQGNFEVNYNLGVLEYGRKNYPKAATYLRQAAAAQPDHAPTQKHLGYSLFQMQLHKEAATALRKALEQEPEDKGARFALGRACFSLNANEAALGVFTHLRADPQYGPQSALYAGTIHMNTKQNAAALEDFAIGLRHANVPAAIALELRYRLAAVHIRGGSIQEALTQWKEIAAVQPDYKDVEQLAAKYREVHSSRHLQSFLLAASPEFLALCRKLASRYYTAGTGKLLSIVLQRAGYADILAQVRTPQWEDLALFRFLRTSGSVGELMLRDFHARLKEVRAGRGVCVSAGSYSEQARAYVAARKIDLVEKDGLTKLFRRI